MAKTNFETLRVYQLSENLADQIWSVVVKWNVLARDTIGKQLIRAADSRSEHCRGHRSRYFCGQPALREDIQRLVERNTALATPGIQATLAQ